MNTIPFGPRNPPEDPLLAKAAELPKEIEPAHDLWPGIAARLAEAPRESRPRSFSWPAALAAGFVVASVSALLTWGLLRDAGTGAQNQVATIQEQDPRDRAGQLRAQLRHHREGTRSSATSSLARFREKFGQLKPETREAIVKNLAVMQTAADQIDAALAKDPASGMLKGFLVGTYKQELQLYSSVVTAGDGLARRI